MSPLEAVLLATNAATLTLLCLSVRSTRRWITACRDLDHTARRYASKRETDRIRRENGGW